jgi:hypothetical protein
VWPQVFTKAQRSWQSHYGGPPSTRAREAPDWPLNVALACIVAPGQHLKRTGELSRASLRSSFDGSVSSSVCSATRGRSGAPLTNGATNAPERPLVSPLLRCPYATNSQIEPSSSRERRYSLRQLQCPSRTSPSTANRDTEH